MKALPRSFYARPTVEVARDLLGHILIHGQTSGRIIEVEAYPGTYLGTGDLAAHSSRGITNRTRVIFGPPGHAYIYLIYGMYQCLNVVTEPDGTPGCVLIRALEPLTGLDVMRQRRGQIHQRRGRPNLASGPGKLTQALAITPAINTTDLTRGPLRIVASTPSATRPILVTPRIGIRHCVDWPLRFLFAPEPVS